MVWLSIYLLLVGSGYPIISMVTIFYVIAN